MTTIDREFFKNPTTDPAYSVSGFWFWNDLITDEKTSEQLSIMKRIHANQPVLHARSGLVNKYLSPDWLDRVSHAIKDCEKNGQSIWIYDEHNWPSGNCGWTITLEEKYREHFLQFSQHQCEGGKPFHLDLNKEYIAISAFEENGKETELLSLANKGSIDCTPLSGAQIIAVWVAVDDYEPTGKLSVDYLSHEAIGAFIKSTHEKYKERFSEAFGSIIKGFFMDETRFCNALPLD
ncbi:MAG: hypothetical protein LBT59_03560 [Clostridiales bacterium]|jgi:hypothetical protein|nr:hypothetical protein [Clostridiales bacterium]